MVIITTSIYLLFLFLHRRYILNNLSACTIADYTDILKRIIIAGSYFPAKLHFDSLLLSGNNGIASTRITEMTIIIKDTILF